MPPLRDRLEAMAERCADALCAEQIRLPRSFATLEEIGPLVVTASGRRLEPARLVHHPEEPRLVKIGLSGDVVPDAAALAETRARLKGQRAKNDLRSKIKRYLLTRDRHKLARITGFLGSKLRARKAPAFGAPAAGGDKAWGLVPGVNFWRGDDGGWRCTDHGAVYEHLLTNHAVRYPSQVGTDLYTNSCAAALFRHMADRSGAPAWREALEASGVYVHGLRQHRRQRLESDHREFDYGPLHLAFGPEGAAPSAGWTNYDPVNVYGLRYFNAALAGDRARLPLILGVLEANQRADGLLADNFAGNAVESADLTYHQYCLAMLCLGNAILRAPRADRIIEKALACSLDALLATGEATYYGRGANNVYHLASFACALAYGAARLGFDVTEPLARVTARLEAFQGESGLWPTAMNRAEPAEMIGWHGSNSQYGALSGFLLAQAAALLAEAAASPAKPAPTLAHLPTPGQLVLRGHGLELALSAGGGDVPWSQGLHASGPAGMTALVAHGRNMLLACDRFAPWGAAPVLVSDLQDQTAQDRRRLTRDGATAATLEVSGLGMTRYALGPEGLTVTTASGRHALALIGACRVAALTADGLTLFSDAGFAVEVRAAGGVAADLLPVPLNPQGPGTLVRLIAGSGGAAFHYRFLPAGDAERTTAMAQPTEAPPAIPAPAVPAPTVPADEAASILVRLAERHSIRDFLPIPVDTDLLDAVIRDGLEAPNACNHQMWHFIVVRDQATKDKLQAISGSNEHFSTCGAIILLCFHQGWNHNKFAVVQSVAAAAYHMSLSAHLRGLGATWNAGIGNGGKIRTLVGLPPEFEIIGTLCLGWPAPEAPDLKPPRRPLEAVRSYERFERPDSDRYPLAPAKSGYRYNDLMNHRNKYSVFSPDRWGWDRIGNFRGYAVYAKSPLPGVYVSRRLGKELDGEIDLIGPLAPGAVLVEVMPYGGSYTVRLKKRYGDTATIRCAELSQRNLDFVRERVRREAGDDDGLHYDVMAGGRLPYADASVDVVFLPQILEAVPGRDAFLDEVERVLRPGGRVVVTVRNLLSWFGLFYFRSVWSGQVPNFGPYVPLPSLTVRSELDRRFRRVSESALSPLPNAIARPGQGLFRLFSRIYAGSWVKDR